jgi:hypothetical protein
MMLRNRIDRLERTVEPGDRNPWCMCNSTVGAVAIDAADYLAGNRPPEQCPVCGRKLLVEIVVSTREQADAIDALEKGNKP